MVFGAEALDLVKLDVGALGPGGRRTGDPPLGARAVRIDTPGSLAEAADSADGVAP